MFGWAVRLHRTVFAPSLLAVVKGCVDRPMSAGRIDMELMAMTDGADGTLIEETITIPADLNGPDGSANGGVAAGSLARLLEGPATVRLHRPTPLGLELRVERGEDGSLRAGTSDGGAVLTATATGAVDVDLPDIELDRVVSGPPPASHTAPRCVVCGPDHGRSLRIFPLLVEGTELVATRWDPPQWAFDPHGALRPEIVWGALDCPGGWAIIQRASAPAFHPALGTMSAERCRPVLAGETVVVAGWPSGILRASTAPPRPSSDSTGPYGPSRRRSASRCPRSGRRRPSRHEGWPWGAVSVRPRAPVAAAGGKSNGRRPSRR